MYWGIDLGGTKIEGVVFDGKDVDHPLCRIRVPTEKEKGAHHIVSQIYLLIKMMQKETGLSPLKVGMGTPGTTDPKTGLLKNSNTTVLNGFPLKAAIEQHSGLPFTLSNDANCFAIAEAQLGSVQDLDFKPEIVVGLIMGTGVGSGVVVHEKVINGKHGIGGEWGHNTLIENGLDCYCGKKGCVERIIAGPALEKYYYSISGNQKSLKEINASYNHDNHAKETIDRLISYFGKAIAYTINTLDPDVIIIGGGVGNIDRLYSEGKKAALPHVFNPTIETLFLKPKLGDSAGVFGAALL